MLSRWIGIAAIALATAAAPALGAAPSVPEIAVARGRVTIADVLPGAAKEIAFVDLGPAPAPGGSRVITRDDLRRALAAAGAREPRALPAAVRVVRRMVKIGAAEMDRLARGALSGSSLPRGATLSAVRAPRSAEVAAGWDAVRASLPRPPHRMGPFTAVAMIHFTAGTEELAAVPVPVDLTLSAEAMAYDLPRGSTLTLVVKRDLVVVEVAAIAGADADVGAILPVTIRPTKRVVRARLVSRERAEIVEGGAP